MIVDTTEGPQYLTKDDPITPNVLMTLTSEPKGLSYADKQQLYLVNNSTSLEAYDMQTKIVR